MRYTMPVAVALGVTGLTSAPFTHLSAQDNALANDRQVMAKFIRDALIPEAAKAKIEGGSTERHREVLPNPVKDIVTYWRSEVSGTATFVEPDKTLTVEVPTLIREKGKAALSVKAVAPVKGNVAGRALTDNGQQILAVASPYTCTLTMTAEGTVTRIPMNGAVAYKVEVTKWTATVGDLRFTGALDKVRGPIENLANQKLKEEAAKLRDTMNTALRKAYEDGRLTLPE